MKRQPDIFSPQQIQQLRSVQAEYKLQHGSKVYSTWLPARAEGHTLRPFWYRVRTAWRVFTGRYDALDWVPDAKTLERELREILAQEALQLAMQNDVTGSNIINGMDFDSARAVARKLLADNTLTVAKLGNTESKSNLTIQKPRPPQGRVGQEYEMPTRHSSFIPDTEPSSGSSYSESSGGIASD